jgi:UDPglucose--hexose-1-phosphate uridylyltransferase
MPPSRRDLLARRPPPGRADVAAGLFELRKDAITGWWVATVVDRAFDRDRFARAADPVDDGGECQNCRLPAGDGERLRTLKDYAFHVIGTGEQARELEASVAQVSLGDARASGSWRTIVAPPGEHRALHAVGSETIQALLATARGALADARRLAQTDHLQVVQNWGAQAGARTNHLCLDLYDLPQIPHRIAEELGGAARFVIREGECPWCRLVRTEAMRPDRLVWQDDDTVAFAPFASRSPFEVWVVPRRHEADFGRASDTDVAAAGEALRQVLGALAVTLDGPPYNLVLHTSPLREQVDATYHWHWEIHPRLREIAGLELGTGLPVNPVSPEDAVEELLAHTRRARTGVVEAPA